MKLYQLAEFQHIASMHASYVLEDSSKLKTYRKILEVTMILLGNHDSKYGPAFQGHQVILLDAL